MRVLGSPLGPNVAGFGLYPGSLPSGLSSSGRNDNGKD
jgi:hypothetical protein